MSFLTDLETSAEHKLSSYGHLIADDFHKAEQDVNNTARVAEVLAKGAWDYTKEHPTDVAKTIAIAAGVGLVSGALTPLLPALAVVGVTAGLGAVGTAALGIRTYEAAKAAMPDLEIVWDADHHSKADIAKAEKNVEAKTGQATANLALLPLTFVVGNAAGTLGTKALVAAASESSASVAAAADASSECVSQAAPSLDQCATTTDVSGWSKLISNPVFNFFSSSYVARNDIRTVISSLSHTTSGNLELSRRAV